MYFERHFRAIWVAKVGTKILLFFARLLPCVSQQTPNSGGGAVRARAFYWTSTQERLRPTNTPTQKHDKYHWYTRTYIPMQDPSRLTYTPSTLDVRHTPQNNSRLQYRQKNLQRMMLRRIGIAPEGPRFTYPLWTLLLSSPQTSSTGTRILLQERDSTSHYCPHFF